VGPIPMGATSHLSFVTCLIRDGTMESPWGMSEAYSKGHSRRIRVLIRMLSMQQLYAWIPFL
jgi:hypothetical protein